MKKKIHRLLFGILWATVLTGCSLAKITSSSDPDLVIYIQFLNIFTFACF